MRQQAYHAEPSQAQSQSVTVLPFRRHVGPWPRGSSLSRRARIVYRVLSCYQSREYASEAAQLKVLREHQRKDEPRWSERKPRSLRRAKRELRKAGLLVAESVNERPDRRRKGHGRYFVFLPPQSTASKEESRKTGLKKPITQDGPEKPGLWPQKAMDLASKSHDADLKTDLKTEREDRGESKGVADLIQEEPDPSPITTEIAEAEAEAEAIEKRLVRFAKETLRVEHLPHDPPEDARSRSYRVEHIAARLAEGFTEADLQRAVFLARGDGFAFQEGIDVVKHAAKCAANYLGRDRGQARVRADVFAEALIGMRR